MNTTILDRHMLAILDLALAEDIGAGDVTAMSTVPPESIATATMAAKQPGVIFGLEVAKAAFQRVDSHLAVHLLAEDGAFVEAMTAIASIEGSARSILKAERVALNFIQHLSGVATIASIYVSAIEGTNARIVDTRKTTPGMRVLEKQAVAAGGAHNHRFGLFDGILIKDNHLAAIGGPDRIATAVSRARQSAPHTLKVEVEVTTLDEVKAALAAGAEIIMLDNMSITEMSEAVRLIGGQAMVEASGGITLQNVAQVAGTGVNLISIGSLTHSAPALDISLDFAIH
ncbi:carboxylating nicotinate-nucleotide diphosphorylase [soil metagenome]